MNDFSLRTLGGLSQSTPPVCIAGPMLLVVTGTGVWTLIVEFREAGSDDAFTEQDTTSLTGTFDMMGGAGLEWRVRMSAWTSGSVKTNLVPVRE